LCKLNITMPFYHTAQFSYKMSTVENGHNIPLVCICKLTKKKQISHKKNVFLTHKMLRKHIGHKTIKIGAPDKPCGVGRADANPKLLLNDT